MFVGARWNPAAPLFPRLQAPRQRGRDHVGGGSRRFLAVELDFADTRGTLLNLLGRDQDLAHVLVGLAEMPLQMQYPIVHPGDVVHEMADLVMDLVRRLAHARIPPDLLDDM